MHISGEKVFQRERERENNFKGLGVGMNLRSGEKNSEIRT